ncbi:MAG TPA: TonB-dependent receptor, partial [Thermoanaerobaculia bacterium]|nr:TonB-dependent receptor [Thermoanaerobaculia bacterium]
MRASRRLRFFFLAFSLLATSSLLFAQTTGNIEGQVRDATGAALPGAAVEATSPALQGVRTATTGNDGRFRFPGVPPGVYAVTASLPGFASDGRTAYVTLDSTSTVTLTLEVAAQAAVVVSGEAPLIDLNSTTTGSNFGAKVLERMSIGRNYADIVLSQPGVIADTSQNLPGLGDRVVNLAVQGSTSLENLYVIDGVNTTNVLRGFQGKAINPETMQEVEIKTGGYQAEYGRALGGVINVVTKSGGNEFHGDAFAYYNSRSMRSEADITDRDIIAAEKTDVDRRDAGADLGGYILKDRLWFFGSYDRPEQETTRIPQAGPVADRGFPLKSTSDTYSAKLTWNASRGATLVGTLFADPEKQAGAVNLPSSTEPNTYTANRYIGGKDYAGRWNQLFGSFGLLTLQYSRHTDRFETKIPADAEGPRITDRTVPGVVVSSGGFGNIGALIDNSSTRDGYSASFAAYLGNHEIKVGGDYEDNQTVGTNRRTGGQILTI